MLPTLAVISIPLDVEIPAQGLTYELLPTMNPCYIYTVIFFAFYIGYAHLFPNVPGKQFEKCFLFRQVTEYSRSVERLGFDVVDQKRICSLKNTRGKSLCFVVTKENAESVCHEFDLLDLKIAHFKYPSMAFDIIVFRNGNVRWYFDCGVLDYVDMKEFYSFMKYDSHERNLKELNKAIDLQKRDEGAPNTEIFATKPSIYVDDSGTDANVIHIVNSRAAATGKGPLLIMLQGTFDIHTPEGKKVYMSLRRYTAELYFFTCASSSNAGQLSNGLAKYSHHGHATARTNPVIMFRV